MIHTPAAVAVPLRNDEGGVIRIGQTRVTLISVIARYNAGDSIEIIHQGFSTVALSDLYAVIAYYLANQDTIDAYILQIGQMADEMQASWEAQYTPEQTARTDQFRQQIKNKKQDS